MGQAMAAASSPGSAPSFALPGNLRSGLGAPVKMVSTSVSSSCNFGRRSAAGPANVDASASLERLSTSLLPSAAAAAFCVQRRRRKQRLIKIIARAAEDSPAAPAEEKEVDAPSDEGTDGQEDDAPSGEDTKNMEAKFRKKLEKIQAARGRHKRILAPPVVPVDYEDEDLDFDDPEEMIFGDRVPFRDLGVQDERLLKALDKLGYTQSTKIQAAAIPMALSYDRRAVILCGETGSGKTLSYLIPAFEFVLQKPERPRTGKAAACPVALIVVPSPELGVQVAMVANQIASAIIGRKVSVFSTRAGWPKRVPDIMITTPGAAATALAPCMSEDEVNRRVALGRINNCEIIIFDECDQLVGGGVLFANMKTVMTAMAAALPDKPREVLPEAQVFFPGGTPVEVLDEDTLRWKKALAWPENNGTFFIRYAPEEQPDSETRSEHYCSRNRIRGPGIALLVNEGPRFMGCCATLPNYKRSTYLLGHNKDIQNNQLYNSGQGSPEWVLKRWFPNSIRIESPWIHRRHPCILQQDWIYIEGEAKAGNVRRIQDRVAKTIELLKEQGPDVRTLVFVNTPQNALVAESAMRNNGLDVTSCHNGIAFFERLEALKDFATGKVPVLVCTDAYARGLDLPICRHVIQLEFASNSVDHLHRVGRTARAGRKSKVTNLWGDGDAPLRDMILQAPAMGLDGAILRRYGWRGRMRRTRKQMKKQEMAYTEMRKEAREAREGLRSRADQWDEKAYRSR
eukprot:TRINITY_DN13014_c4_g2_i1.p1 TRINITY_DN13014_c4_g2~~TRINITY_DN13014_c4_g2_i1.p1  ORF type:complete len:740 (+),score=124.58 TRINITY_DN13014_c4_g2_i1:88-2307(+)